jgi:hypothetical protein
MVSTARSDSASTRLSLAPFAAGVICLIVVHIAIVFLLCGSRAFVRSFAVPSEFVAFFLPAVAVRVIPPGLAAFLLTVLSFSLSLLLAFNAYGT